MDDTEQLLLQLSIPQLLRWRFENTPKKVALREKEFGIWRAYTYEEYYATVRSVGLGLDALGFGKDDKLALIGDNIPEMLFTAVGAMAVGGIGAGIYQTSLPDEIAGILNYLDVSMVFCDDQEQVDKLLDVRDQIPNVKRVIYEDPRGMRSYRSDDWFVEFKELLELGGDGLANGGAEKIEDLINQGKPDDCCFMCLTSGTTGLPKGSMMMHRNYINMGIQISKVDRLDDSDEYLSFLPFAWIGEQMNSFGVAMATGITINFPESVETSMEDLKEVGPHFMFGAPRIYETIQSQIWLKIDDSYWLNRKLYHYFIKIGRKAAPYRMSGKPMPPMLALQSWIGSQMIFRPLINQLGLLRLRRAYTGGAALGPDLFTFYQAIGVNLKQIYGQTEITGIAYMHLDGDIRPDTVGKPLPETQCRISDIGEILSKSPSVCAGYYKLPDKTEELLEEGWLHSGDAGFLDKDGHLVVIDRISDVMHTKEGHMFSPMFLENKLKFSPYVKEAVIFGDQEDFVSVLINIDPVIVGKWAEDRGISFTTYMDLSLKPEVAELIHTELEAFNRTVEKPYFRIRRYSILYKLLDTDDGELTKTGKIRRKFVREKYSLLYETLYDEKISEKEVEAEFTYQDGQTTKIKTNMPFYSMDY
ncbi:MAG: AMP-binding protein [Desulfobacteraceae bacterium]|jgi:long-chain acyl-CoA synthetase